MSKKVKAIVVACNTASSVALTELKKKFDIPVIGMIEPGAKMAINETKNSRIGVIGTRSTINDVQVIEKACPLFVPLAEEGWTNHRATVEIAEEYLHELRKYDIDTLVLGCTHYPILSNVIQKVIGDSVTLIDSGVASASVVKAELEKNNLENDVEKKGSDEFYVSDIPTTFKSVAELFLGRKLTDVHKVDLETFLHT